jgi:hypothetical protein
MYSNHGMKKVLAEGPIINYNIGFSMRDTSIINFGVAGTCVFGDGNFDIVIGDEKHGRHVVKLIDYYDGEKVLLEGRYQPGGYIAGEDDEGVFIRFKKGRKTYIVETEKKLDIGTMIRVGEEAP